MPRSRPAPPLSLRELRPEDIPVCAEILAGLPDWFGLEASNRAYVEALGRLPAAVVESGASESPKADKAGHIIGFAARPRRIPATPARGSSTGRSVMNPCSSP